MVSAGRQEGSRFGGAFRRWAVVVVLAPFLGLGGCASYLSAQVTSFHRQDQPLEGRRFVVEPAPDQRDSLEFDAYAAQIRRALVARGLLDATGGAADVVVSIRFSIDAGRPVTQTYPYYGYRPYGPGWGPSPYWGPGGYVRYGWAAPYPLVYGVVGHGVSQSVVYRRELRVVITERRSTTRGDAGSPTPADPTVPASGRLYEGTAISEGSTPSLAPVMPALIRALFQDFPGPNGGSRVVQVVLEPEPLRR